MEKKDNMVVLMGMQSGKHIFLTLSIIFLAMFLASCQRWKVTSLKRHDLFTISLGTLPNELDWFYRDDLRMVRMADIQTQDGLIFLSGGDAGKVLVFNSYGDLITYVYNPDKNSKPVVPDDGTERYSTNTWNFLNPRSIETFKEGFLVDDGVDSRRKIKNADSGIVYDRVVLQFDSSGKYQDYLGQEGYGGTPFPYIVSVHVRKDGGIVVISRITDTWISYWFDRKGTPMTTVKIQEKQLPGYEEGGIVSVYTMRPDPVEWTLHIRVDLYPDEKHGDLPDPRLYTLDLNTLVYEDPIMLHYLVDDDNNGGLPIPPDYLGTTEDGTHFMLTLGNLNEYRLVLIDNEGRIIQKRRLKIPELSTVYRHFRLQRNGIITGIFWGKSDAFVSWWRADKLIKQDG